MHDKRDIKADGNMTKKILWVCCKRKTAFGTQYRLKDKPPGDEEPEYVTDWLDEKDVQEYIVAQQASSTEPLQ